MFTVYHCSDHAVRSRRVVSHTTNLEAKYFSRRCCSVLFQPLKLTLLRHSYLNAMDSQTYNSSQRGPGIRNVSQYKNAKHLQVNIW